MSLVARVYVSSLPNSKEHFKVSGPLVHVTAAPQCHSFEIFIDTVALIPCNKIWKRHCMHLF